MHTIWFRRVMWGYFPIHWKGVVVLCFGVMVIVPSFAAGLMLSPIHPALSNMCYGLAAIVFLGLFFIARRHSE